MKKLIQVVCLSYIMVFASSLQACNLKKSKIPFTTNFIMEKDSIPHNAISDSVMNIVYEATKIKVTLYKSSMDSILEEKQSIILDREQMGALKFAFMLSEIKSATATPYSQFRPNVSYLFTRGERKCSIFIDFGTGQMNVKCQDAEKIYFISEKILLMEAVMLFSEDEFMKFLLNNESNE